MRDHSKTLRERQPGHPKQGASPRQSAQTAPQPVAKFKSTFRSGTVPPPATTTASPEDKPSSPGPTLRRVEVQPITPSLNATLLGNSMSAPEAMTSTSPPPVAVGEPQDSPDAETLTFDTRNDGTRTSPSQAVDALGRTLVGVSRPPPKGPIAQGHVKSAQVRSVGAPDAPRLAEKERRAGRNTKPDPHQVNSVRAEPVSMPMPGVRARHEQPMVEAKARNIGAQGAPEFTDPAPAEERPSLIMAARNRKLDKVLYVAVGLAVIVVGANEVGLHWPGDEAAGEGTAVVAVVAAPSNQVEESLRPSPEVPKTPVSSTTKLDTSPSGAQILQRGAVIANTPAMLPRTDKATDYLLRKPGYESQLVRISADSPPQITLELSPSAQP